MLILPRTERFSWPDSEPLDHYQIVVIFSLVYGKPVALNLEGDVSKVTGFLANLLVYADYYGLLGLVRVPVEKWLSSLSGIWVDIRDNARSWVGLSRLLLSEPFFRDAMKPMAGSLTWAGDIFDSSNLPADVREVAERVEFDVKREDEDLRRSLAELIGRHCPMEDYYVCSVDEEPEAPVGQNAGPAQRIVEGVFSNWFIHHIFTSRGFWCGHETCRYYWNQCRSYRHLYECAKKNDLDALTREGFIQDLAETFRLEVQHLQNCINKIFTEILLVFRCSLLFDQQYWCPRHECKPTTEPCCDTCMCYKAKCDSDDYFTYMNPRDPLAKEVWGSIPPPIIRPVYTTPATTAYEKCLGVDFGHDLIWDGWNSNRHLEGIFD
jgi:hypothetical protein